jgi:hypothetical protein
MGDIATDNFKKSVLRVIEIWHGELANLAKQLDKNGQEIAKLEALKSPSPEDKKRLETCKATREKLRNDVAATLKSFETNLNMLVVKLPNQTKENEKDLIDLPAWMKKIIKDKGLQLFKGVTFAPTVDIDFKAKKLKSFGLKITW